MDTDSQIEPITQSSRGKGFLCSMLMFLSMPMIVFFLLVISAFAAVIVVGTIHGNFVLNTMQFQIVSASVLVLYIIIGVPALVAGLVFATIDQINGGKKAIWISMLVYLSVAILWSMFLAYKATGHIPAVQVLFSGSNFISYEIIMSALFFCAIGTIAAMGFVPLALLCESLNRKGYSGRQLKSGLVLLSLAACLMCYTLAFPPHWWSAVNYATLQ